MKNRTKQMLREGKQTCGGWLTMGSDVAAEIMAQVGFDWICIDTEHGHGGFQETRHQLQAISTANITPIVRVPWNDLVSIKKTLDLGAQGLIIPWINTKEQAEQAVRYCKYPPEGIRGFAGGTRIWRYGFDDDYLQTVNDEILIAIQIETREAINNLKEIVNIPGIDVIFVGPGDLSFSLGCPLDFENPDHQEAMKTIETVAKNAGIPLGTISAGDNEYLAQMYERGYQFVAVCCDMELMGTAAKNQFKKVKADMLKR
jgi:2-keto-3-deoxy-L-rhamnonate aldolase RhmA